MEDQNSKSLLPVVLAVIITAVIVGGGMYWWQTSQTKLPVTEETETIDEISAEPEEVESTTASNQVVEYNCEQSGGTFGNNDCSCPTEQGEQLEYDSETGYCMSAFGIPGGELGETAKDLQELEMLKNQ